jgi:hypothetical protein
MDSARNPDLASRIFGASPERALALMRAAWPAAVGPELARRTEVVALDRGILRIRVADATWQRGLVRMRGDILARLRRVAGSAAPRALGFVEGPVREAPDVAAVPQPAALAPSAGLVAAAEAIPDPQLRAQFLAVATRYVARFAGGGSVSIDVEKGASGAAASAASGPPRT